MGLLFACTALVLMLSSPAFVRSQLTTTSSVLIRGLEEYASTAVFQFNMLPVGTENTVPLKVTKKQAAAANARAAQAAGRRFASNRVNSSSCSVTPVTDMRAAQAIGRLLIAETAMFVDDDADNLLDHPRDTEFLTQPAFNQIGVDAHRYEVLLSTSDRDASLFRGTARRSTRLDPTTNTLVSSLSALFVVQELLTPFRLAPMWEAYESLPGTQSFIALDPSARTGNLSCQLSGETDLGYLHLAQPVPNEPTSVGGYGKGVAGAGVTVRFHHFTVFFDENADNKFNPWERALSPSALVALQNAPAGGPTKPFLIQGPGPIPAGVTFEWSVAINGDDGEQILLTIRDASVGTLFVGQAAVQVVLTRAGLTGAIQPHCGSSDITSIFVAKSTTDVPADLNAPSTAGASYFLSNAERASFGGFQDETGAAIRLYRPLRGSGSAVATPRMRSSNQFAIQCRIDVQPIGAPGSLSARQIALQSGSSNGFSLNAVGCTGMSAASQLTLGDTPACEFDMCFHNQATQPLRFYEAARYLSFALILTNATEGSISPTTVVNVLRNYRIAVTRNSLNAYNITQIAQESGARKLEFRHSLDRNVFTTMPNDPCLGIVIHFNYTQCSTAGQNLLLEIALLASTLPFPEYRIRQRAASISLLQTSSCVAFNGGQTTSPTSTPSPTDDDLTINDSTGVFVVVFLVVILVAGAVVWFYIV